MECEIIGF